MPGPSNARKKSRKSNGKNQKNRKVSTSTVTKSPPPQLNDDGNGASGRLLYPMSSLSSSPNSPIMPITPASPFEGYPGAVKQIHVYDFEDPQHPPDDPIPQAFIHDPGNGPRVRDTTAFLASFFAQKPALHDPMCAEFAQDEVLQMLKTVLPEETALILWYNKSRATSRICPACQRLYRLGDSLPGHISDDGEANKQESPQLTREQQISGLCSPVCFILATFNYPGVIKSAWGAMANEMDDLTWQDLNGPGEGNAQGTVSSGLGMLVRMTRLHDLGLGQLCFPEMDLGGLE